MFGRQDLWTWYFSTRHSSYLFLFFFFFFHFFLTFLRPFSFHYLLISTLSFFLRHIFLCFHHRVVRFFYSTFLFLPSLYYVLYVEFCERFSCVDIDNKNFVLSEKKEKSSKSLDGDIFINFSRVFICLPLVSVSRYPRALFLRSSHLNRS